MFLRQVASIPRRVCLSSDPSDAPCGTLRAWAHSVLASTPPPRCDRDGRKQIEVEEDVASVTLQLFLEHAAGERSAFAPWVTMLPLDNDDELNLPALWPADDRAALRGTVVLRDTEECLTRAMVERNWVANALARRLERTQEGGEMSTMAGEGEAEGVIREWCNPSSGEDMRRRPGLEEWLRVRCAVQSRAYRVGGRYVHRRFCVFRQILIVYMLNRTLELWRCGIPCEAIVIYLWRASCNVGEDAGVRHESCGHF